MTHCRYFLLREKDGETSPASPELRAAAHPNPGPIFIDNPTCDPQTKTSTRLTFCGEEWLKNSSPAEIPGPLSAMKTRTPRLVGFPQSREAKTCNSSVPSGVKASSAFPTRLEHTWVISLGKPRITSSESYRFSTITLPDRMAGP